MRLRVLTYLVLLTYPVSAQDAPPYQSKPKGHEENKQLAARVDEGNRKKHAGDRNRLVLPGLVADKQGKRIEVMVESTGLRPGAPCEFTVIGETSDHAYEALLISFAKPSDVHRALQFIGTEPGQPFDPGSLRFWAKGERFVLSIAGAGEQPLRLEELLVDRRTGKALRKEGFLFTGSRLVPAPADARKPVYAADEFQPKSIVSLFNSTDSVLDVAYSAPKGVVYQNTIVNPDHELPEGAFLTLVIEPASADGSKRVKELVLQVQAGKPQPGEPLTGMERLGRLRFQLNDAETVLNEQTSLLAVVETLAALDRTRHDYYLAVRFGEEVELGQARALAKILATLDCEQGVRIEPPPAGQLYYRAFTPDENLLHRDERAYHPAELSLSEKDGKVSGKLVLFDAVWKNGSSRSELAVTELRVAGPDDLRQELDAEAQRTRAAGRRPRPPVIMAFAPPSLTYRQLVSFLAPTLATCKTVHVYLDMPMPPIPTKSPPP